MTRFQKGDRVFTVRENTLTKETQQRWGTVQADEIEGWDYIDVKFDDFPAFPVVVVAWYIYREGDDFESPSMFGGGNDAAS